MQHLKAIRALATLSTSGASPSLSPKNEPHPVGLRLRMPLLDEPRPLLASSRARRPSRRVQKRTENRLRCHRSATDRARKRSKPTSCRVMYLCCDGPNSSARAAARARSPCPSAPHGPGTALSTCAACRSRGTRRAASKPRLSPGRLGADSCLPLSGVAVGTESACSRPVRAARRRALFPAAARATARSDRKQRLARRLHPPMLVAKPVRVSRTAAAGNCASAMRLGLQLRPRAARPLGIADRRERLALIELLPVGGA